MPTGQQVERDERAFEDTLERWQQLVARLHACGHTRGDDRFAVELELGVIGFRVFERAGETVSVGALGLSTLGLDSAIQRLATDVAAADRHLVPSLAVTRTAA